MQPVYGSREDLEKSHPPDFESASLAVAEEGSRIVREGRGTLEGDGLEQEEDGVGGGEGESGHQLEDMVSRTLNSIVDRHFQQLDLSLKKLVARQTQE